MNITTTHKSIIRNSFNRFVKSDHLVSMFYCTDSKEKDEKEGGGFNLTTGGSGRDKKESAKEENFFYKQSLEQLKALKKKLFKDDFSRQGSRKDDN